MIEEREREREREKERERERQRERVRQNDGDIHPTKTYPENAQETSLVCFQIHDTLLPTVAWVDTSELCMRADLLKDPLQLPVHFMTCA